MSERAEAMMGPVASKLLFENEDVKIWEADVGPGEDFPLHHHTYDYVLFTTGAALLEVRDYGRQPSTVPVPSHAVIFIPAGGIESYGNGGQTRDFATSNALAGREPLPGVVHLLENSRVRILETMLGPGESTGISQQRDDAAIFVLSGAKVRMVEQDENGKRSFEEIRPDNSTRWLTSGVGRELVNLGSGSYRELSIQVK